MSELEVSKVVAFSDDYIRICFQFWYMTGCKSAKEVWNMNGFPVDDKQRKVAVGTLRGWMDKYMWRAQADTLDAQAMTVSDNVLVRQKAEMLKRQAQDAWQIAMAAKDHLLLEGFDSSAAAVNAYFRGTEEERKAKGIGDLIEKLAAMSDKQLEDTILKLASRADEDVIDVQEVPIDTESSKIEE